MKQVKGITNLFSEAMTHEGAAAYDLKSSNPLVHLVFTKGSVIFTDAFYTTQQEEIFSYSRALIAAEEYEKGFAWKFAHWMRDPVKGKGNRIQGSIASAILAAKYPRSKSVEEYVHKCLCYRPDDVIAFAAHFVNLGLGDVPEAAKKGMGKALNCFDEYQILKYSKKQAKLVTLRKNGKCKTLRLVDVMGIAKRYLDPFHKGMYIYLHAATKEKKKCVTKNMKLVPARSKLFLQEKIKQNLVKEGRITIEQLLSRFGNVKETWKVIISIKGLLPDKAFIMNLRNLYKAGFSIDELLELSNKRLYKGIWMHELYAGYKATQEGIIRRGLGKVKIARPIISEEIPKKNFFLRLFRNKDQREIISPNKFSVEKKVVYKEDPVKELAPVFNHIFIKITKQKLPKGKHLGIADISGSMFGVPLGGKKSSLFIGDVACVLTASMALTLELGATFSNDIYLDKLKDKENIFAFVDVIRKGQGWGSTQVLGSTLSLIRQLLADDSLPRPDTLWYFSDMQFHPPEDQGQATDEMLSGLPRQYWDKNVPPLEAAIKMYQEVIGPVDIVLWNLNGYDSSPVKSAMNHVLLVSGFDTNTFELFTKWKESRRKFTANTKKDKKLTENERQGSTMDYIRKL